MDKSAVMSVQKNLQKATAENAPPSTIMTLLNELKDNLKATEDLLRSTKIGVVVNRSKTHSDPAVARLASEIVKKWRDDIQKQKGGPSAATNGAAAAAAAAAKNRKASPAGNSSPAPRENGTSDTATSKPAADAPKVPLDQRDFKKDKVDVARTNQETRDRCIGLIYNGLCFMSPNPSSEILAKAVAVEAAGFAKVGPETNPAYSTKMRSLFMNLKNKSNPGLRQGVLNGNIEPERFVMMTMEELKTKERKAEDEKFNRENMKDSQMPQAERSVSSSLQCKNPVCGKMTVAYTQAQTRRYVMNLVRTISKIERKSCDWLRRQLVLTFFASPAPMNR